MHHTLLATPYQCAPLLLDLPGPPRPLLCSTITLHLPLHPPLRASWPSCWALTRGRQCCAPPSPSLTLPFSSPQGFLAFLLGSDPRAAVLRSSITFVVVPMLNPDGVFLGNYR